MRAGEIKNDRYLYHLKYLQKNKLIEKKDDRYYLTEKGSSFIANLDAQGKMYSLFKISVAVHVFRNDHQEILVQKRLRNPFYGDHSGVAGKVKYGESVSDACKRKLLEETGLIGEATPVGTLRKIRRNTDYKVLEDTLYYECYVNEPEGKLDKKNEFGENYWYSTEKVLDLIKQNVDIGKYDSEIYKRLINKDFTPFILEQDTVVESY
jgi:ADP-ribose pyrophosphatase YjhB (NUDIX family)